MKRYLKIREDSFASDRSKCEHCEFASRCPSFTSCNSLVFHARVGVIFQKKREEDAGHPNVGLNTPLASNFDAGAIWRICLLSGGANTQHASTCGVWSGLQRRRSAAAPRPATEANSPFTISADVQPRVRFRGSFWEGTVLLSLTRLFSDIFDTCLAHKQGGILSSLCWRIQQRFHTRNGSRKPLQCCG